MNLARERPDARPRPRRRAQTATLTWLAAVMALAPAGCSGPRAPAPAAAGVLRFDAYGGVANVSFAATGFFHLVYTTGHDWFVDPAGHLFFSAGVNHVALAGDTDRKTGAAPYHDNAMARYGTAAAWTDAVVKRFHAWHVNTAGAWSDVDRFKGRIPYTVILNLAQGSWHPGSISDVFSQSWKDGVDAQVAADVAPRRDDKWLLGYFTDNELRWTRDWTSLKRTLFDAYLSMPDTAPGKRVLIQSLRSNYPSVAAFDAAWDVHLARFVDLDQMTSLTPGPEADATKVLADQRRFLGLVAERYFSYTTAAIRAADPHHLVLGCRFISLLVPKVVLEAAGRHVDVVSVNNYVYLDGLESTAAKLFGPVVSPDDFLARFAAITGKPILVSETGFRAADSGLPNDYPPVFPVYATQKVRADAWERYLRDGFGKPYVVGIHWFEYEDEPKNGRFDGEDSNWGLVDVKDDPYTTVVDRFESVYPDLYRRYALGVSR